MKYLRMILSTVGALGIVALAGCGGGGGGASGSGTTSAGAGGTGGTGGTTTGKPAVAVTLQDSTGASTNSVNYGIPLTVQARVTDAAGSPASNAVVSFSADSSLVTLSPSSGTALTNSSGIATIQISSAALNAAGAGQVTANVTIGTDTATGTAAFSVGAAAVSMTALNIGSTGTSSINLAAFGTTSIVTTVTVNGAAPTIPLQVSFTSGCAAIGKATVPASVQAVNGIATATYQDNGCAATDTITATVANTTVSRTGTVTVAGPQAANIQFSGTNPASGLLVLKGTGGVGYSETSVVTFKVVDSAGNGLANQNVGLGLTTGLGGITLDSRPYSAGVMMTKQTDASGNVSVTVQSGTAPTAVWVVASLQSTSLSTQSNKLTISTGRPAQDFFSLSATTLNIDGGNYDGAQTTVTARVADRLGNLVADGTVVNFISEGAHIISSSGGATPSSTCSTLNGSCSVTLESAEYRPTGDSEPSGLVTRNRVSVLAYTLGEESFVDANGNNYYDAGETFTDLGDVFIDNNENGTWNASAGGVPGEQYISFGSNASNCTNAIPTSPYAPSKSGSCDGAWGSAHVRRDLTIVLSGNTAKVGQGTAAERILSMAGSCTKTFLVNLRDQYDNPLPATTALAIADSHVTDSTGPTPLTATVSVSPSTVGNTTAAGGTFHTVTISAGNGACVAPVTGFFNLTATTPRSATTTTLSFTVN